MPRPGWSRRAPWPYDLRLGGPNGLGLMLIPDEDGQLVAVKSKPLDAAPATYQYETQQPFIERTYPWRDLFDGMGQQSQPDGTPRRVHYDIDIDGSINGHTMLGPLFHAETVASGKQIKQILVAQHAGAPAVFALAGDAVYRRTADAAWAVSLTLGGGSQVNQAVRFKPKGTDTTRPYFTVPERLPPASLNKAYSYRLSAGGGTSPYSWGIGVGHLPAGLSLNASTGVISGTPTAVASTAFQLRVLDAANSLTAMDANLRVESTAQALAVDTFGALPEGKLTEAYGTTLNARGGTGPYTWAITSGALPSGLALDTSTGVISGTPTAETSSPTPTFTVRATDAVAATATAALSIRVRRPNDDYLYLASTASNLCVYDGSTWTTAASTQGPPEGLAQYVAVLDDEFWVLWEDRLAKAEANPLERDNYSGSIVLTLAGTDATWLAVLGSTLFAFKTDGVYTINKDGTSQNILPQLRSARVSDNGRNATIWLSNLWVPIGNSFYYLSADGTFTPAGTEQLLENASEVRGRIVCSAGHNTWFNYCGLFNATNGCSYLLKYGTWIETQTDTEAQDTTTFHKAYNGALKKWSNKQITAMTVISAADLGTTNDRLYCGFADGTVEWAILPRYSPNPMSDSQCEFGTQGFRYFPLHHASFPADTKNFRGWSIFGPQLSNLLSGRIAYRVDQAASFTELADADGNTVVFSADGQRYNVPGATLVGKTVEVRLDLRRDAGASVNTTPLVYGVAIHEQLRPAFVLEWTANVDLRTAVARHDGTTERRSPSALLDAIRVACASFGATQLVLPDGSTEDVGYIDYSERLKSYNRRYGLSWEVAVKAMQYRTLSPIAQAQGLSYGTLEAYDYSGLEGIL